MNTKERLRNANAGLELTRRRLQSRLDAALEGNRRLEAKNKELAYRNMKLVEKLLEDSVPREVIEMIENEAIKETEGDAALSAEGEGEDG